MVKEIMQVTGFTIEKWKEIFGRHAEGHSVSTSSISNWRQGKQQMSRFYKEIFINLLCDQKELREFEQAIRQKVMESFHVRKYQKLYWDIIDMEYEIFLTYILYELKQENFGNHDYSWDKIPLSVLYQLCVKKAVALYSKINFRITDEKKGLLLTYVHEQSEQYTIGVGFLLGESKVEEIEKECIKLTQIYKNTLLRYLFITYEVSDELYLKMLERYNVFLLKIDFYDINNIKVVEAYIIEDYLGLDEETLCFMNILADVVLHKLYEMNLIVLKEILCYKFDCRNIDEQFWGSNSGIWMYKYPVRRALAFEEKLINQKIRTAAKRGNNKLEILDINLSGGLLGLRCSFGAGNVTSVDISPGSIQKKRCIIDKYNKVKSDANNGIDNVKCGYLRMDTMEIIGVTAPKDGFDLIILGLGGGSYIPDLDVFLRQIGGWLKEGKTNNEEEGGILLSVFNQDALCFSASQAKMDFKYDYGVFRHIGDEWSLPAKLYTYKEICHMAMKYYDLLERYSYPTILSIVPETFQKEIMEKLKEIDKDYACRNIEDANKGLFHTLYLKKVCLETVPQCYLDVRNYISNNEIVLQIIQHEKISSRARMVRELSKHNILAGDNFVKTVVLLDEKYDMLIFYLLPLNKRFQKKYLEVWYAEKKMTMVRRKLRFCTESELQGMGLVSGSVSPFSYPMLSMEKKEWYIKQLICDMEILNSKFESLYTYSGDLEVTYKIGKNSFIAYLKANKVIFI